MTDREKVIRLLQEAAEYFRECRNNASFASKAENHFWELQNAMNEASELLKAQSRWISVKDRLPGIDEDVLILYESKVSHETGYAITCLKDSFYFGSTLIQYQTPQWLEPWQYFRENNAVTHWMSLPEPQPEGDIGNE